VGTGSIFTWIDNGSLKELGIEPLAEKRKKFRTVEGRGILRDLGEATLELAGDRATRIVVFAEKGDFAVLGADSLEGLGFEIDPVSKNLKKLESFAAYSSI
jgi:predicted aspartyl protease